MKKDKKNKEVKRKKMGEEKEGKKEEEKKKIGEEIKKFWKQKIFRIWVTIAIIIAISMVILGTIIKGAVGGIVIEIFTIIGLSLWLKRCFKTVGSIKIPCSGVRVRFGRSVEALPPGLYFFFDPIEKLKEYPTGLHRLSYKITNIHSKPETIEIKVDKETKSLSLESMRMDIDLTLTFRWPKVGKKYRIPVIDTDTGKAKRDDKTGRIVWKKVDGGDILKNKTFYHLPVKNPKTAPIEEFDAAFGKTITGAGRKILATHNHQFCRVEQEILEDEIKEYLLSEVGNPLFDCGFPVETVDIEISQIKFTGEKTEEAFEAPEIAWRQAEAAKNRAEGEAEAIKKRREAFKDVPEPMRAMLSAGIGPGGEKGAGLDLNNLVTYLALPVLLEKLGLGEKKELTRQELIDALKKLSPEEIEELLKK